MDTFDTYKNRACLRTPGFFIYHSTTQNGLGGENPVDGGGHNASGVARALPAGELAEAAAGFGIPSEESHTTACTVPDVQAAMSKARTLAAQLGSDTLIFVGGSTFVVADLMAMLDENKL